MSGTRPYEGFDGVVDRTYAKSEPAWNEPPSAPEGAPNIVVMLVDDLGFSDLGCYGSEIETPNIDALAGSGVRFSNFHVTPMCSPTRAALLTGINSHAAGVGYVTHIDPGFPGYASELPDNQPTVAEMLRDNGYGTFMVGKWHLTKNANMSEGGSKASWPLQRGFDQYYGFLEGLTDLHNPHRLYDGNSLVEVDEYPEGYYLTDDLTDRALRMIRSAKTARADKPFLLYYAHGAVHAPLHAKPEDIERQRGRYDCGWDVVREKRFDRQKELGLIPADVRLPPRNFEEGGDVRAWDDLSTDERTVFARYMEVYAAMVTSVDDSVGRIIDELTALGELDNTVFLFTSDNGASREGGEAGSIAYFRDGGSHKAGGDSSQIQEAIDRIDEIGGPQAWAHYPRGWAMAGNTPFRLYKLNTFAGGHQVPLIVSGPPGLLGDPAANFRNQYTHVTDLLPTIADIVGVPVPTARHGMPAKPLVGKSMRTILQRPDAEREHHEQYYECIGNRAYYNDGWEAVTNHRSRTPFSEDKWFLYDLESDPTQIDDLSEKHPEVLAALVEKWDSAAWNNQVYPLTDGTRLDHLYQPPSHSRVPTTVRILPGTTTLERARSNELIAGRGFKVDIDLRHEPGDEGVLVAHGGQAAGYAVWVEDGQLIFEQNQYGVPRRLPAVSLTEPCDRIEIDVAIVDKKWSVAMCVDGVQLCAEDGFIQPAGFLPFEGIDVGIDRRSPVSWDLRQRRGCFPYTGHLRSVTYHAKPMTAAGYRQLIDDAKKIGLGLE